MANVVKSWKRVLVVGCSHGKHIDPAARKAVLDFKARFKPQRVVHLGDFCDTAAFRSGCKGTADESERIEPDIDGGLTFLAETGTTDVLCGNHEDRLWHMAHSPNAVVSYAAMKAIEGIREHCRKRRATLIEYAGTFQKIQIGNFALLHGYMYGENAIRDHAEAHGNVIHAHTHRPGIATGRRDDHPIGICVGTLTARRGMEYAKSRRATLSWGQGFAWGEYCDNFATFNLCLGPQEQNGNRWILP